MKNKRLIMGSYSFALAALALAGVILINLLFGALPSSMTQWDLTSGGVYTLGESTKQLLAGVKEEITVHLIAQSGQEDPTLLQLLERYREINPRLGFHTVDPVVNPQFVSRYTELKLNENSLIVEGPKRSKAVDYTEIYTITSEEYLNYYYTYGEYIPDTFAGESALSSAINYVTTDVLPVVGVLSGHGEKALSSSLLQMMKNANLSVEETALLRTGIPKNCRLLLINAPSADLSEAELEILRTFLKEGNNLFLITDPTKDTPKAAETPLLDTLCAEYGIERVDGVIVEEDPANYYLSPYYLFPSMETHEITEHLLQGNYSPYLTLAHGLKLSETSDVVHSLLLESSAHSYSELNPSEEEPRRDQTEPVGPFAIGVLAQKGDGSRLLQIGSASLTDENVNPFSNGANLAFFLNACSFLAGKIDTLSIHSTSLVSDYLTVSQAAGTFWTSLFCAVLPLGIACTGVWVWLKRRAR